jgi:hypothetical protein
VLRIRKVRGTMSSLLDIGANRSLGDTMSTGTGFIESMR